MKLAPILVVSAVFATLAMAQRWEFGGGAGGGFYISDDITSPAGNASGKITTNLDASVWLGNNGAGHWGGELRYDFQLGDLELTSGGTKATFAAQTHSIHYDVVWNFTTPEAAVRPFVAVGAGIKDYVGTGTQVAYQPLEGIALLTKASDLTPLASAGAGFKFQLSRHVNFRIEVRDYLTPFPKQVITPNTGAKVSGWLQDFVPLAGISYTN